MGSPGAIQPVKSSNNHQNKVPHPFTTVTPVQGFYVGSKSAVMCAVHPSAGSAVAGVRWKLIAGWLLTRSIAGEVSAGSPSLHGLHQQLLHVRSLQLAEAGVGANHKQRCS